LLTRNMAVGVGTIRYGAHPSVEAVGHDHVPVRGQVEHSAGRRHGDHEHQAAPKLARAACEPVGEAGFGRVCDGRVR
jgi:hypothetical protein